MKLRNVFGVLFHSVDSDPKFQIKGEINSFNYDYPFPNAQRLEKEENLNLLNHYRVLWLLVILIGTIVGVTVLIVTLVIEEITVYKIQLFNVAVENWGEAATLALYFVFTIFFSVISCVAVVFWEPIARGPGTSETLCYLNGIDLPGMETWNYIPARLLSVISGVTAGLPAGQTEGLIPIGTSLAANICLIKIKGRRIFPNHSYDNSRRELAAVGLGASAAASFGTPVGAMFFVLQQLSTWLAGATVLIFVGSLFSSMVFIVLYNNIRQESRVYNNVNVIFSPFGDPQKGEYTIAEFPLYVLLGVFGGILGIVWITVHEQLSRFRARVITTKLRSVLEIISVAILCALVPILALYSASESTCIDKKPLSKFEARLIQKLSMPTCKGQVNLFSFFLMTNPENMLKMIFTMPANGMSDAVTACLFVCVFTASSLHLGTATSTGVIIPNLIMGALWGRLFYSYLAANLIELSNISKFTYLAAVAQVSGVTQYAIAFGVMMSETVGVTNFPLPVFLVIFISRYVSSMFKSGTYTTICAVNGFPLLAHEPPPLCINMRARDIMSKTLVCLPLSMTAGDVRSLLEKYTHMEFPVLAIGAVTISKNGEALGNPKGIILRNQLLALLVSGRKRRQSIFLSQKETQKMARVPIQEQLPSEAVIDIEKHMNHAPMFIHQDMHVKKAHALFETLNLHTLLVVNESNQLVGLLTRKNFAVISFKYTVYRDKFVYRTVSMPQK